VKRTTHSHDGSPLRECLTCNNTAAHGSEFCRPCDDRARRDILEIEARQVREDRLCAVRYNIENVPDPRYKMIFEQLLELIEETP
jgi:hypothetical protein